jgi:hypothetical protein
MFTELKHLAMRQSVPTCYSFFSRCIDFDMHLDNTLCMHLHVTKPSYVPKKTKINSNLGLMEYVLVRYAFSVFLLSCANRRC